ncbi:SDR family oxidoreductase [Roseomonas xinghualingensis]|uniref:SDR family oxidoreductase n=1 Tax=Roseomonas xinghualingensis TaxID=2986475 RepID=UPI0021F24A98|nr:SDR family oxidoreductase [Roseomonas sp. SXEYE001]MCV4209824.1 SDR family oxidoreductase [Roseomonas sp. SXEYE001]
MAIFGATSAIAQAVARGFAEEGARLFLVARDPARLEAVAADLRVRGASSVATAVTDLTETAGHAALVEAARNVMDGIDAALIAHGTLGDQRAGEADAAVMLREIEVNLLSPASLMTYLGNLMEAQQHGSLAVIGSVAGDRGRASNYIYGSAKGGLRVFTQGLRHRLGRAGVAVTLVEPGFVDTPMTAGMPKGSPLWATPARVGADIHRAMKVGPAILYTPWFWRPVMLAIRLLPDAVFKRLKL